MEDWVPLLFIVVVFGLPIGGWITIRVLQHRERMVMLQQGIVPPPLGRFRHRGGYDAESPQACLRRGIVTTMVGIALLIGLSFIGWRSDTLGPSIRPGPWLLGGLVPMFVGIAQILIALLSGAEPRFGSAAPPFAGPPPRDGPTAYPGRPGPTYQELGRPVPPPDRR